MIPYTTEARADTRVSNVTMGIWLFLASEVMLFGALFSSYALLRVSAASWPAGREVFGLTFAIINSVVLLALSSIVWRARRTPGTSVTGALILASVLAAVFVAIKSIEYSQEMAQGLVPAVSTFIASYYVLTGMHALHVIAGLIANLWIVRGVARVSEAMTAGRLRAVSLYWWFVDVVWLVILMLVYLT